MSEAHGGTGHGGSSGSHHEVSHGSTGKYGWFGNFIVGMTNTGAEFLNEGITGNVVKAEDEIAKKFPPGAEGHGGGGHAGGAHP